jgi:DNA-binding MarR family transcriptional regulator
VSGGGYAQGMSEQHVAEYRPIDTLLTPEEGAAWRAYLWSSTVVLRGLDADMAADGLDFRWFDVLIQLYSTHEGVMPLRRLVDSVVLSRSGLTRLLDRMERAGMVTRAPDPSDRRRFFVSITPAGREAFERVWPGHQRAIQERFMQHVPAEDLEHLRALLTRVIEANEARERSR